MNGLYNKVGVFINSILKKIVSYGTAFLIGYILMNLFSISLIETCLLLSVVIMIDTYNKAR